jgi:TRAP-type C4-dicarboxylate transport system permease small subunit
MLSALERLLLAIDWVLSRIVALVILTVMVLIVCDVFGRYLFSRPLPWVYDIVSIYVVNLIMYFLASEVLRTRSNIELDLHFRLLPPRLWSALQGIAWFCVAAVLALASWRTWISMGESLAVGEIHPGLYEWPVWAEKAVVAIGLTLLACRILARFCRYVQGGLDASVFNADESAKPGVTE